jgi:hypothetical protein
MSGHVFIYRGDNNVDDVWAPSSHCKRCVVVSYSRSHRWYMRGFRGVLVNFALLSPPAIATTSLGKSKHCRGRCQDPLRRIATAGGSVEFLEWLLFQKFVLAVVKSFFAEVGVRSRARKERETIRACHENHVSANNDDLS